MTTEREAQAHKICPSTRTIQHPEGLKCIGRPCMHWRWTHEKKGATELGYCGSAGKH